MKKLLVIAILIAVVSLPFARATSMLLPFWAIDDQANVIELPSIVLHYPDQVILYGLNLSSYAAAGIHTQLSDNMTLGIYYNVPYTNDLPNMWDYPPNYSTSELGFGVPMPFGNMIKNYFHLIFGLNMDKMKMGFMFNMAGYKYRSFETWYEPDPPTAGDWEIDESHTLSEYNFTFDLRLEDFAAFDAFNFAVNFGLPSSKLIWNMIWYDATDNWHELEYNDKSKGANYLGLKMLAVMNTLRLFLAFQMNNIGHLTYYFYDENKDGEIDGEYSHEVKHSLTYLKFGVSRTMKWEKLHVYAGSYLDLAFGNWFGKDYDDDGISDNETTYKTTEIEIPVFFSAEFFFKNWLVFRGGFRFNVLNMSNSTNIVPNLDADGVATDKEEYDHSFSAPFGVASFLGTGFIFNNIQVDITFDPEQLFALFLLSGPGPIKQPVVFIRGIYNW